MTFALNPFAADGDRAVDHEHGPTVDVSAATMTRLRTPFAPEDPEHETTDQSARG
ncbi:hypothetical protein [Micromonospora sp. NPDC049301]|uniref:hypothetical protein n=1 Tax=Micromonospora sp. NPDC049301 TaxID=3155723 RepID=UPI00342BF9F3